MKTKKSKKRLNQILSIFLAVIMVISSGYAVPIVATAETTENVADVAETDLDRIEVETASDYVDLPETEEGQIDAEQVTPETETVSSVEISSIDYPVAGEHPDYVGDLPKSASYHFASGTEYKEKMAEANAELIPVMENGVIWYNLTTNKYMTSKDTFVLGNVYTFYSIVAANEGKKFANSGSCSVTVNAESIDSNIYVSGNDDILFISIAKSFTASKKVIKKVDITGIDFPVGGNTPDYVASIPKDANYHLASMEEVIAAGYKEDEIKNIVINGIMWKQYTGENIFLTNSDKFIGDSAGYYFCTILVPNEGCEFAAKEDLVATIDGDKNKAFNVTVVESVGAIIVTSILLTAQKPVITIPEMTDSDKDLVFKDSDSFDIPEGPVKLGFDTVDITQSVSGGTLPYVFSKKSGPDWIEVDESGYIKGKRPETVQLETSAVILVTDAKGKTAEIEIKIGKVYVETGNSDIQNPIIQKGQIYKVKSCKYKVTNADTTGKGTVTLVASTTKKTKLTSTSVPSTVKINGKTFKVTAISDNAFKNCKKLKKVTIGSNVTKIGKNAFYGCKVLKTITVKSKKVKTVGSGAFKGINKKCKIKVPSSKLKAYKKTFAKKGQAKTVKISK